MRLKKRIYPSKLLLFGEYGVLLGLDALAAPFMKYSGRLELTNKEPDPDLVEYLEYLKTLKRDFPYTFMLDKFEEHVNQGLRFNSNIPLSYGLGSSGALIAAIFENYIEKKSLASITDPRALKTSLALLEAKYHGVSSGIDPMVSLLKKPILVRRSGKVYQLKKPVLRKRRKLHFFLLDSKQPATTGNLVGDFLKKMEDLNFSMTFREAYTKYSNGAIRNLIDQRHAEFYEKFKQLSIFQLEQMRELIPDHVQDIFHKGLTGGNYALKVCGSGGGGYFLGVSPDKSVVDKLANENVIVL